MYTVYADRTIFFIKYEVALECLLITMKVLNSCVCFMERSDLVTNIFDVFMKDEI